MSFLRSKRNPQTIIKDTFCYDCNIDTAGTKCGPHSVCFLSKEKFDKLKK